MKGTSKLAILLVGTGQMALGQTLGGRAPQVANGGSERGMPTMSLADPQWMLATIAGVPRHDSIALSPSVPGEPTQIGHNWAPPSGPISWGTAGTVAIEGSELVWRVRVEAPGAGAMRLHLGRLSLPAGARITVCGDAGGRGYVIRGRGASGTGEEWTPVLDGARAYVEYRGPAANRPTFAIEEVAEIAAPWPALPVPLTDLVCEVDVQCETVDATARDAVCWMVFSSGTGTFVCTGTLLNDTDPATTLGWLLTARHCINTASAAASLTAYWFYQTPECNGQPPDPSTLPTSQGAALIASDSATDVSLLKLSQDPTSGQGLAGWTGAEPVGTLWSIHHPGSTYKRVASGHATWSPPICFGILGYYQYHYVNYTLGITEDVSAGAPLFNAQWQVVGQLFGSCAISTPTCSNPSQWNAVFGRLSRSLPLIGSYLTGQTSPGRIYVDAAAVGAGTGASWVDAYTSLTAALQNLNPPVGGTEVWVARGTYRPGSSGATRESAFTLVRGVKVYGGFAGTESAISERDIAANPTILSGDLAADDGPNFANRSDNAYHVIVGAAVDQTAVVDGFIIKGGNANGPTSFSDKGGGMYIEAGSPMVRNCTFTDNTASYSGAGLAVFPVGTADVKNCTFAENRSTFGGAVSMTGAAGVLELCVFDGNTATSDGGAVDLYNSSPTLLSCMIRGNTAGSRGGGVHLFPSGQPAFQDCRFVQNHAGYGGGGAAMTGGQPMFGQCVFLANTAAGGGGGFGGGILLTNGVQATATLCRFLKNISGDSGGALHVNAGVMQAANCEFSGNKSTAASGGAAFQTHDGALTLRACTLAQNVAATSGGGVFFDSGVMTINSSIAWGNTDAGGGGQNAQVRSIGGSTALSYSLIEGLTGSLGGTGNIAGNPLFLNAAGPDGEQGTEDDDLSLGLGSPAVDAGDNLAVELISGDLRGNARRQDDPCQADTGNGTSPIVDMGAIERTGAGCAPCYANCDESTSPPALNVNDFNCFLNRFAAEESWANCDGSTAPPALNVNDFNCFLNTFAAGCS